jgi:hypothetical protein
MMKDEIDFFFKQLWTNKVLNKKTNSSPDIVD